MGTALSTPPSANEANPGPVRAVAYYRSAAESAAKDGLETQQDHVRTFARRHDLQIIHEFADRGQSGRSAEGRPAFTEMMHWVRTRHDFMMILVYDGSRWGRFQADDHAHYESLCTEHGKRVIYTTLGFTRDEDKLIHRLRRNVRHYQIDEYRRALSEKVRLGTARAALQGYHTGGSAPYGFQRMLLDANHKPERILQPGERKTVQNRRVVLVPGEKQQVEAVQQIFCPLCGKAPQRAADRQRTQRRRHPFPPREQLESLERAAHLDQPALRGTAHLQPHDPAAPRRSPRQSA